MVNENSLCYGYEGSGVPTRKGGIMIKKYVVVAGIFFLAFLSAGFASAESPKKNVEPYVANFNYTPASRKAPGSSGVTLAVGPAIYVSDAKSTRGADWRTAPQLERLNAALREDLSKLLMAKGFSVRGPFDSYDLVPYSDKKQIDLFLIPALELLATWKDTNVETEGFSQKVYHGTGTIELNGKLTIQLQEMMTRELMWTKNIPVTYSFPYDVRFPFFTGAPRPFDMSLVIDDLAKGLEQQYPKMLETLSNLIDPEEMRVIKRQAQELKRKKGY